jgi:PadR family transcriptional regulator, regulatory protein PadR
MSFKSNLDALVLGALCDGPLHGYAIAKTIERKGAGALRMGENQLYPTLHKLEREGAVVAEWQPQENKPPRKVYSLTPAGEAELEKHRKSWSQYAAGVGSVLGLQAEANRG